MLVVRFRAYAPNGASLGILPHPLSWEAGIPLNDMSSLTMTYPDGSEGANLLKAPCEVALELRHPVTGLFAEYPGCRYLNIKSSMDMAARPRIMSFTMPSYGWMLKKVRFMDQDNPRLNKDNKIVYKARVTPGQPVRDMITAAKFRNNIPGLTYSWNNVLDSAGVAWGVAQNIGGAEFDYGQDAWSILDSFSKQGLFDWWMNKRELELFKVDTVLRRQLDTDTGVHVHSMLATSEEPVERTWEELAGFLAVLGDQTVSWLLEAPDTVYYPWGKWDEMYSASGVSDDQSLAEISDRLMLTKYKSRSQFTKRFAWTEGAPVPLADYRPGDFIRAMDDTGSQKAAMRVYQITLSGTDPYGVSVALTLNDRFTDRALQVERWVSRGSGGGGPVGGGGTGGGGNKPPPPPIDSARPKLPTGVAVANAPYFSTLGEPVSTADVSFTIVTKDINNRNIDVAFYNVAARRSDHNAQQARIVRVRQPSSPSTGQVIHGFVPMLDSGYTYYFSVQTVRDSGYASEGFTDEVSQAMGYPTQAPEIPSKPVLSSKLSTVQAEWDGNNKDGAAYPAELREVQVEVSKNNSTWFHVGDILSPGSSVIMSGKGGAVTWNVGDTVYVRFRSRNSASVISAPSEAASIVVLGVTGPDVQANSITANEIATGTLTAEQIKAHSISVESLSIGNPNNLIVDPALTSGVLNAHRITVSQLSSAGNPWTIANGKVTLGNVFTTNSYNRFVLANNTLLSFPVQTFPGPVLSSPELAIPVTRPLGADNVAGNVKGRLTVTVTGVPSPAGPSTITVSMLMRQFGRDGMSLGASSTIVSNVILPGNGTFVLQSLTGGAFVDEVVAVIPYVYVMFENGVSTNVKVELSGFEVWQENSVYIGNGLVKAPLIAANAVTTDKLSADAITAKHSIRSAYYEMVSQSGIGATVKITENANYSGQSGIMWDGLAPSGGIGPRVFQVDGAGTGGWDARAFAICGPEQVLNSSGRIDVQMAYGVTNSYIRRVYGPDTYNVQGIWWDTQSARFRIGGMFNTGHYTNDMFRFDKLSVQNGTYAYGNVTSRRYYPILSPNGGTAPVTSSIRDFPSGTESGFRFVSSTGTTEVYFLVVCGTP